MFRDELDTTFDTELFYYCSCVTITECIDQLKRYKMNLLRLIPPILQQQRKHPAINLVDLRQTNEIHQQFQRTQSNSFISMHQILF